MLLFWCVLCVSSLHGVLSQAQLVQPSSEIRKPGESVKMSCKTSGYTFTDYNIHWIQQLPGKGLTWIGYIYPGNGGTSYSSSYEGRFTITRDNSITTAYLQIDRLSMEDSATYYCTRRMAAYYFDVWGNGQSVLVTSVEVITPHVFPVTAIGLIDSTYTFACLVKGFLPQPVSVTWNTTSGETVSEVKDFTIPLTGEPPAYSLLSQVTVSNEDWSSKTYQCIVSHYSTQITKIIPNGCDLLPEAPSVHLLQGTCPESSYGEIKLTCQIYNLASQKATLKWYINDQERHFSEDILEMGKSQNHFYALHSTVTLSQSEWNNGVRVKCHVTDTKTGKTAEDTIKKCSENFNCLGINVFIVRPSVEDLYIHKTARIACVASNLKDTKQNYSFEWSFTDAPRMRDAHTENPVLHKNGTYSVSTVLNVSPDVWLKQTEFICVFRHNGLQTPIIARIKKEKETKTSQPVISIFPPSPEDQAKKEEYTLLCLCRDFHPRDIYIGWTENDIEVSKELYVNSTPRDETSGNTYFIISKLTIPASNWDSGNSYSCVVGHETIPMNFTRRSIDKYSGNPTKVNVSVTMSDTTMSCY